VRREADTLSGRYILLVCLVNQLPGDQGKEINGIFAVISLQVPPYGRILMRTTLYKRRRFAVRFDADQSAKQIFAARELRE
jgi:hypothetical protein